MPEDDGTYETDATIALSGPASTATRVRVSAAAVSPAVAGDFRRSGSTLTIAAGETTSTGTVTITANDNIVDAPDKAVTVSGEASGPEGVANPAEMTLTIADDEAAPTVELRLDDDSIRENGRTSTVTARLSGPSSAATTVTVSVAPVSPAVAGDFTLSGSTLTIAAGETDSTGDVTIAAPDNDSEMPDREVRVSATASGGRAVDDPASLTLRITDDDDPPTLSIDSLDAAEGAGTLTFTVTKTGETSRQVTVRYATSDGTATSGSDYTAASGTLTFAPADASKTIAVTLRDDEVSEPNETVTMTLSSPNNAGFAGDAATIAGTGTIDDDEATPTVTLTLDDASISENGGRTRVRAALDIASSAATAVTVSAAPVDPAVAADFTLSGTTLTIAAGSKDSSGTVRIAGVDNTVDAPDKTVTVSGMASNANGVTGPADATLTLADDDGVQSITLSASPASVDEAAAATTVTITATIDGGLTSASATAVTVTVPASADNDYTAAPSSFEIEIAPGASSATGDFTLTPVDDELHESAETITVTGVSGTLTVNPARIALVDDDAPATEIALSVDTPSVAEDVAGGTATVTVTATLNGGARTAASAVTVTVGGSNPASAVDYATAPAAGATFPVLIPSGSRSGTGTFTVTPTDDDTDETDATIALSGSDSGRLSVTGAEVTVADDDAAPAVTLILSPATIDESGAANRTTVTAALSRASSTPTRVTVSAAAVDPATAGDFRLSGTTLTIAADATDSTGTVTIAARDNDVDAPDKEIAVSGAASGPAGVANPAAVTLTIADDEAAPTVELRLNDDSIREDSRTSTVTARLDHPSSAATTVTVTVAPVSPAVAGDFPLSANRTLTIAAGATGSSGDAVTITTNPNEVDAPAKTVTVSGSAANSQGATDPASLTLTIEDDDATPTATLALSANPIAEGASATVSATLDHPSSEATTLTVSAVAVSPAVAGDFTLSTNPELTIAAGSTTSSGTVRITANDNDVAAPAKTVTVSGMAANANGVTGPADASLTIAEDDTVSLTLSASPATVDEAGAAAVITVTATIDDEDLTSATAIPVTVTVPSSADYAAAPSSFGIEIPVGERSAAGDFTLTPVDDELNEGPETITVTGVSGSLTVNPATITLTDDDAPASAIALSVDTPSVAEDVAEGTATVTVTATLNGGARLADSTVTVTVGGSNPDSAVDYATLPVAGRKFEIKIVEGMRSGTGTFTVTPESDDIDETDATIALSGSDSGPLPVTGATVAVTDDDPTPVVTLVLSESLVGGTPETNLVQEGDVKTLTATLDRASGAETTVTVAVTPHEDGSATAADFTLSANTVLTIPAGELSSAGHGTPVTITAHGDNVYTGRLETLTVGGATAGGLGAADPVGVTLQIVDDEAIPTVTLTLDPDSIEEEGGASTVTAELSGRLASEITVTVSGATSAGAVGNPADATLTIADDDAPEATVAFGSAAYSGTEGGSVEVTVTLTLAGSATTPEREIEIDIGAAREGGATSGDYGGVPRRLTFAMDAEGAALSQSFTITVDDDPDMDPGESLVLSFVSLPERVTAGAVATATVALRDNDSDGIELAASPASVEGAGATNVTLTATLRLVSAASLGGAVTLVPEVVAGGTAAAADYMFSANADLVFSSGAVDGATTSAVLTVTAVDDAVVERAETLFIGGSVAGFAVTHAEIELTDNDAAGLSISGPSDPVAEGEDAAFVVTLSASVDAEVSVAWSAAGSAPPRRRPPTWRRRPASWSFRRTPPATP